MYFSNRSILEHSTSWLEGSHTRYNIEGHVPVHDTTEDQNPDQYLDVKWVHKDMLRKMSEVYLPGLDYDSNSGTRTSVSDIDTPSFEDFGQRRLSMTYFCPFLPSSKPGRRVQGGWWDNMSPKIRYVSRYFPNKKKTGGLTIWLHEKLLPVTLNGSAVTPELHRLHKTTSEKSGHE